MYRIYRSNVQGIYSLCIGCYTPLNGWLYIHSLSVTNKKKNNIILIASIICLDSKLFGQKSPFKEIFLISLQRVKLINWLRSIFDCFESESMGVLSDSLLMRCYWLLFIIVMLLRVSTNLRYIFSVSSFLYFIKILSFSALME